MKDDKKEGFKFFRLIKIKMTDETRPKTSFLRKVIRCIPFVGMIDYKLSGDSKRDSYNGNIGKMLAHATPTAVGGVYLLLSWGFNSMNPIKWYDKMAEVSQKQQVMIQNEARAQEDRIRMYNDLSNQLFGTNGLADVNRDGRVDFTEKMDALDRAGCVQYGIGPISIRQAATGDLQRAINSYRQK